MAEPRASFIRPEARRALWQWRECLVGAAAFFLGLLWVLGPGGLLGIVGGVVMLGGVALLAVGVQRARFRRAGSGPGVVQVDERRITYFGPLGGGSVAVPDLERLVLDPSAKPAHWALSQPGQPPLFIPVNAEAAETLFDVFATLPGLRTERMLAELNGGSVHPVVIWERRPMRPASIRLH